MTLVPVVLYNGLVWVWFGGAGGAGMCGVRFSDRMGFFLGLHRICFY